MYHQKRRNKGRRNEVYLRIGKEKPQNLLKKLYLSYYNIDPALLLPVDIQFREFAFQPWGSKSYVRHLSFDDEEKLRNYLKEKTPLHAYHSIAFYELPEAPKMEEKGFLGAELLFDIDADHLPGCEDRFEDECLIKAAKEAEKLIRMIKRDFNAKVFSYFTGNRGFHIRVWCENCLKLGRDERRMIGDYIAAIGIDVNLLFPEPKRRFQPAIPSEEDPGWRGWIGRSLMRSQFFREPNYKGSFELRSLPQVLGKNWKDKVQEVIETEAVKIDLQVTQDISRLTRIPGTLNGKASMLVTYIDEPARFIPSKSLSPFDGRIEVEVLESYQGKLMGEKLSLRKGEKAELPAWVAVTLITKGVVKPIGGEVIVRENPSWRAIQNIHWPPRAFGLGTFS